MISNSLSSNSAASNKDANSHINKIFIGGLSPETTKEDVEEYFSKYGDVIDAVVMTDPNSGRSRGFGFVKFSTLEQVDKVQKNRDHTIKDKLVETKRATPKGQGVDQNVVYQKKVFMGSVPQDCTKEDIQKYAEDNFGEVEDVFLNTQNARYYAFITFSDYDAADKMILQRQHKLKNTDVIVNRAQIKNAGFNNNYGGPGGFGNFHNNANYNGSGGYNGNYYNNNNNRQFSGYNSNNMMPMRNYNNNNSNYGNAGNYPVRTGYNSGGGSGSYNGYYDMQNNNNNYHGSNYSSGSYSNNNNSSSGSGNYSRYNQHHNNNNSSGSQYSNDYNHSYGSRSSHPSRSAYGSSGSGGNYHHSGSSSSSSYGANKAMKSSYYANNSSSNHGNHYGYNSGSSKYASNMTSSAYQR